MCQPYGNATQNVIAELSRNIQNKKPNTVRSIIIDRFGPAKRDVGSGVRIEQWNVADGVLTYHPITGVTFNSHNEITRLIKTTNIVIHNLFGSYEMTTLPDRNNQEGVYWIGNLTLTKERYIFKINRQHISFIDENNYFLLNPKGTVQIEYLNGITPENKLEDIKDGTVIARLTFAPQSGISNASYNIVTNIKSMRLYFESIEPLSFEMDRGWDNYW